LLRGSSFRAFFAVWVKFEYLKEPNPDQREILKSLAMGGNSGKNWAEYLQTVPLDFKKKIGHITLREAHPIFEEIKKHLSNSECSNMVIQIGSSSGKDIAFFADMFPLHEFVGTDIYDEVVEYSNRYHNLPNLSFKKLSAKEISILLKDSIDKPVLVFSIGSIQYVQPEHLVIFFSSVVNHKNLKILVSEPGNESKGSPDKLRASIYRGDFSYTHDYKWYAEEVGIVTVKCEIIRPFFPYKDFPEHRNTVIYFYYGKTSQANSVKGVA